MANTILLLDMVQVDLVEELLDKMQYVVVLDQVHLILGKVLVLHNHLVDLVQMLIMVLVSLVKVEDIILVLHITLEVVVAYTVVEPDGDAQLLVDLDI